jgi:Asp-tRNA(Asn)/Glu-tRNA(Gln) amidotransferase A subunit family amidase
VKNIDSLQPPTKAVFEAALTSKLEPWQVFQDIAEQTQYTRDASNVFNLAEGGIDVLLVPSVPFHPTIKDMVADPLALNSKLGVFTHPGNVVDLCGISINAGFVEIGSSGQRLPFGVTLLGGTGNDGKILDIAAIFEGFATKKASH